MPASKIEIARVTWQRFYAVVGRLLKSSSGPKAIMLCGFLLLSMIAINALNVINSYVGRDFMSAIENRYMAGFQLQAILYILVFAVSTVAAVFFRFSEERLGILWREQLTQDLVGAYLTDRTYYKLAMSSTVPNPDQRITEDVRAFTTTTLSFILLILNGTLTAISFSGVLWSISPQLFAVAVGYAFVGSLLTILLGKKLIRLNYQQLDLEANFRSDLIHIRENADSIALAHREGRFTARLARGLNAVTANFRRLIRINRNLGFFTTSYNYMIQIIPALIVAPLFIMGDVREFGVITQSTMAFATLVGAFSLVVTQFQSISAFTAVTARLNKLNEAIEKVRQIKTCGIEIGNDEEVVNYQDVTVHSADQSRVLVSQLNMRLERGSSWLVTAADDAPKVALFRATASVWDCGEGVITRPGLDEILFLPERPYLPPGPLRDVLLRTGRESTTDDAMVLKVLNDLGLDEVVKRAGGLDVDQDWDDLLSIGEQHLISISRIFLANPKFVFLDRPGSSLAKNQIGIILNLLAAKNIGVVTFSKNGESHLHYDAHLAIEPDGSWTISQSDVIDYASQLKDLTC